MKRTYCKCPYCPFISVKYRHVSIHVEYIHPDEELVVVERYDDIPEEVSYE